VVSLRPQDVAVLIKLALHRDSPWTYTALASALGISVSDAHASVRRCVQCRLMTVADRRPVTRNLIEFLQHGVGYVFAPKRGELGRGVPTAHAAPPLKDLIVDLEDLPPVWPYPDGKVRGEGIEPLYPGAVVAALKDQALYECLALVDALRIGKARERKMAADLLGERLKS